SCLDANAQENARHARHFKQRGPWFGFDLSEVIRCVGPARFPYQTSPARSLPLERKRIAVHSCHSSHHLQAKTCIRYAGTVSHSGLPHVLSLFISLRDERCNPRGIRHCSKTVVVPCSKRIISDQNGSMRWFCSLLKKGIKYFQTVQNSPVYSKSASARTVGVQLPSRH